MCTSTRHASANLLNSRDFRLTAENRMGTMLGMENNVVTVNRSLDVEPAAIFSFLADRDRWPLWQGIGAVIDPRPGGAFLVNLFADKWVSGWFDVVEPNHRVAFSWGTICGKWGVPPGSSSVEITLESNNSGRSDLYLVHRGLALPAVEPVQASWRHYVNRLVQRATGRDPGPDTHPLCGDKGRPEEQEAASAMWQPPALGTRRASDPASPARTRSSPA
jgi:uncharacterized protein YndB with AHSA1/START domain